MFTPGQFDVQVEHEYMIKINGNQGSRTILQVATVAEDI